MENNNLLYKLERGSKKHLCPNCDKKRFVRYVDSNTSEYLPERYGRCDREVNCGYHLSPYNDGFNFQSEHTYKRTNAVRERHYERSHIPFDILRRTFESENYNTNDFLQNLMYNVPFPFSPLDVERVVELYCLGTIGKGYMAGALTIPFVNRSGCVRAIQLKKFDKENHGTYTNWIHSLTKNYLDKQRKSYPKWLEDYSKNDKLIDCLFGEHLLKNYPDNPIALVEAPKTAIYGTLYFGFPEHSDNLLWLAVFNLSSLNKEKCKELRGRRVVLFPDLSKEGYAFKLWKTRADEIQRAVPGTTFTVSDLLERNANVRDREKGLDLADYLIKLDWREFRNGIPNSKSEQYERISKAP